MSVPHKRLSEALDLFRNDAGGGLGRWLTIDAIQRLLKSLLRLWSIEFQYKRLEERIQKTIGPCNKTEWTGFHTRVKQLRLGTNGLESLWFTCLMMFMFNQIKKNVLYQDNKSSILLETNGRTSAGKRSRALNIRYFFVTIKSNLVMLLSSTCQLMKCGQTS